MKVKILWAVMATIALGTTARAVESRNAFVGRYGHVITFEPYWKAKAAMVGEAEVIMMYSIGREYSPGRFEPSANQYKPENFGPMGLIQITITPRASSRYESLADVRKERVGGLSDKIKHQIIDEPKPGDWPDDSFEIAVNEPHRYRQLYTENAEFRFIVTCGFDKDFRSLSGGCESARWSLHDAVSKYAIETRKSKPRDPWAPWKNEGIRNGVAILTAISLILWSLGRMWVPLRIIALLIGVGPWAAAIVGLGLALILKLLRFESGSDPLYTAIIVCGWCFIALAWGRRAKEIGEKKSWYFSVLIPGAVMAATLIAVSFRTPPVPEQRIAMLPAAAYFMVAVVSIVALAIFSGIKMARRVMGVGLVMASIFASAHADAAAPGAPILGQDPLLEVAAWNELQAKNITRENILLHAANRLPANEEPLYYKQRVEITGFMSADDTAIQLPLTFDDSVKPSFVAKNLHGKIQDKVQGFFSDPREVKQDMRGVLSAAGKDALLKLRGQEINQIFAHSWGSEIIYNAILQGVVKPPRFLAVMGPPDRNFEKWRILAEKTGTIVRYYSGQSDPVPDVERAFSERVPSDRTSLLALWEKQCKVILCLTHPNRQGDFEMVSLPQVQGHSRFSYYAALRERGVIGPNILELGRAQEDRIMESANEILMEAVATIRQRRKKDEADAMMLSQARSPGSFVRPATATPVLIIDEPKATPPFTAFFPEIAAAARQACASPADVPNAPLARLPLERTSFFVSDLGAADRWSSSLSGCAQLVFLALARALHESRGNRPDRQWLLMQASVAHAQLNPPPPQTPSSSSDSGPTPGYSGGPQTLPPWAPTVPLHWK